MRTRRRPSRHAAHGAGRGAGRAGPSLPVHRPDPMPRAGSDRAPPADVMIRRPAWLAAGLALVTCATLLVEILSTRLLSVLTWYHLSFLAVTRAMLGMASGAAFVFLRGGAYRGAGALTALPRATLAMAAAIALSHLVTLTIPIPPLTEARLSLILPLATLVTVLGVPFFFSGVAVTL